METRGRQLQIEERLIEEAIALVGSGRSRRVVVAGLPDTPLVMDAVRRSADRLGLRVRLLPEIRAGIVDVAVERFDGLGRPTSALAV